MLDVALLYYTQSGNTRRVAERMGIAWREAGHAVRDLPLERAGPEDALSGQLLAIGGPTHAGRAPTALRRYLAALPRLEGRKACVFATAGGGPGRVLYDMARRLEARGAEVIGGFVCRGEVHHPAPSLVGRFPGRPNAEDLAQARRFALDVAAHIGGGYAGALPGGWPDVRRRGWGLYSLATPSDALLRRLLPGVELDAERCRRCGRCAAACPMQAIRLEPTPRVVGECARCYQCVNACPERAWRVHWGYADRALALLYAPRLERWFGDVGRHERLYR